MGNKALNWLISHSEIEEKYVGEYVAIGEDGIVAHGKDFKKVLEEAEMKEKEVYMHKVFPIDKEMVV